MSYWNCTDTLSEPEFMEFRNVQNNYAPFDKFVNSINSGSDNESFPALVIAVDTGLEHNACGRMNG